MICHLNKPSNTCHIIRCLFCVFSIYFDISFYVSMKPRMLVHAIAVWILFFIIDKINTLFYNIYILLDFHIVVCILPTYKTLMIIFIPVSMHFLHFFLYRNLSFIVDFVYCCHNFLCGSIFLYFLKNLWICFHFSIIFFIRFEGIQTIH